MLCLYNCFVFLRLSVPPIWFDPSNKTRKYLTECSRWCGNVSSTRVTTELSHFRSLTLVRSLHVDSTPWYFVAKLTITCQRVHFVAITAYWILRAPDIMYDIFEGKRQTCSLVLLRYYRTCTKESVVAISPSHSTKTLQQKQRWSGSDRCRDIAIRNFARWRPIAISESAQPHVTPFNPSTTKTCDRTKLEVDLITHMRVRPSVNRQQTYIYTNVILLFAALVTYAKSAKSNGRNRTHAELWNNKRIQQNTQAGTYSAETQTNIHTSHTSPLR